MILADKIIYLRKKKGWSQEELADRLDVTRQSVSKWESAQSTPDLDKVLKLAEIFEVTTDYLLKDNIEEDKSEKVEIVEPREYTEPQTKSRRISMAEAKEFIEARNEIAPKFALAVSMFIMSPICLILLGGASEYGIISISEDKSGMLGVAILMVIVAIGVAICITSGMRLSKFEYIEKEPIELEAGLEEKVRMWREEYRPSFGPKIALGVLLCVLSVVPLFISGVILDPEDGYHFVVSVGILLAIIAVAVNIFIKAGMLWESYDKLLEEGDYTRANKDKTLEAITSVYWLTMTAIYLAYSFITFNWDTSWIIWPVAGVTYAIIRVIYRAVKKD